MRLQQSSLRDSDSPTASPASGESCEGHTDLQFGDIFPVTYSQVRFSPPGSVKLVVQTPDLTNPFGGLKQGGEMPDVRGNLYLMDPELATPYSQQYNFSWEPDLSRNWRVQLGYVGSRSNKLLVMWYLNRGQPVPGTPADHSHHQRASQQS